MLNYDAYTDEEMVALTRQNDPFSANALCTRYKGIVRACARPYYLLGADREDLVQEGMIGLYRAIGSYRPDAGASFRTFAELCIRAQIHTAVDASARYQRSPLNGYVPLSPDADGAFPLDGISAPSEDPAEIYLDKELRASLYAKARERLSALEWRVFELYADGLSYKDIAARLGKNTKSVDNALKRMREKLGT